MRVGLISDTHGILPGSVVQHFEGVDLIVHAGDVGGDDVLEALEAVAPVMAVHGNCDVGPLRSRLPAVASMDTPCGLLVVTHRPPGGTPPFASLGTDGAPRVVVFGHTHFPKILEDGGVMLVNPGSACHGRGAPPTAAILTAEAGRAPAMSFVNLDTGADFPVSVTHRHTHGG